MSDNLNTIYNIIGVRQSRHKTSLARRHAALTTHEQIDLRSLHKTAEIVISLIHVVEHLIILLSASLSLAKTQNDKRVISVTSNALEVSLGMLELCQNELDMLVEVEVDICALRPEHRPPLIIQPHRNRTIASFDPDFSYNYT